MTIERVRLTVVILTLVDAFILESKDVVRRMRIAAHSLLILKQHAQLQHATSAPTCAEPFQSSTAVAMEYARPERAAPIALKTALEARPRHR